MSGFMEMFDNHEAPEQPEKGITITDRVPPKREVNWQSSNNERFKRAMSNPVQVEQKDESKMAYWRMFTQQMPKGEFEQSVNLAFGGREAIGELFREKKVEYIELYKSMLASI